MPPFQRVPTSSLREVSQGKSFFPDNSTNALRPSLGSVQINPPDATRLIAVDHQLTTYTFTAGSGTFTQVTWPSVGFPGLLAAQTRYFNSGASPGLTAASVVPGFQQTLVTGQSTQLALFCALQNYLSDSPVMIGAINFQVFANSTQTPRSALVGPWFSSGVNYTGFSCTPSAYIYAPTAVSLLDISLGISAELFAVFVQS